MSAPIFDVELWASRVGVRPVPLRPTDTERFVCLAGPGFNFVLDFSVQPPSIATARSWAWSCDCSWYVVVHGDAASAVSVPSCDRSRARQQVIAFRAAALWDFDLLDGVLARDAIAGVSFRAAVLAADAALRRAYPLAYDRFRAMLAMLLVARGREELARDAGVSLDVLAAVTPIPVGELILDLRAALDRDVRDDTACASDAMAILAPQATTRRAPR